MTSRAGRYREATEGALALPDHTHPEYEGAGGGDGYDDTELIKRIEADEAVIAEHDQRLDTDESQISKNRQKIDNIQNSINTLNSQMSGKADIDHVHDSVGGAEYDDTEVRDLIQGNTDAIAEIQTKGYDDTELRGLVEGKADEGHTHDGYDDTEVRNLIKEEKDKNIQQDGRLGNIEAKEAATAEDIADLYALADKKSDTTHTHDAPDLTHEHEGMVVSASVTSIVKLSQAEFDALADKDASTLYLVV